MILDRLRHRARGLAGADHDRAPGRARRQMRWQTLLWRSRTHRSVKQIHKKLTWFKRDGELNSALGIFAALLSTLFS
jgi:hypothetical protein